MEENTQVDKLLARLDNLPITAAIQKQLCAQAYATILQDLESLHDYENLTENAHAFLDKNHEAILRRMATPIESAIFGVNSLEIARQKGNYDEIDLINADPAETFGELKLRLKQLNEDFPAFSGKFKEFKSHDLTYLHELYSGLTASMLDTVVALQKNLATGKQLGGV